MSNARLDAPILAGGILNTNFFNGRILAAEDLTALQTANAQQHRQLGRAIGDGVAWGFHVMLGSNVDPGKPVLHITKGLALNSRGDVLALSEDVDLSLADPLDTANGPAGFFAACEPPQGVVPTNLDCYILTATPASGLQGSAPMAGISNGGFASRCASRYTVEGLQFGLLPLGVSTAAAPGTLRGQALQLYGQLKPRFVQLAGLTGTLAGATLRAQIAPTLSKFRNLAAHLCFGTDQMTGFFADPLGRVNGESTFNSYGILDDLRAQNYLTRCAVPLALIYWTAAGIQFIDMWSVRRPVFPAAPSRAWPVFTGNRRMAEGIAAFLQFQDHLANLPSTLATAPVSSVAAADYFRYLPAGGVLPVGNVNPASGFDYLKFFSNHTTRSPVFIEGARLDWLLSTSFAYPPIDLTLAELIFLYQVRENQQGIDNPSGNSPSLYIVFSNGQIPFQGDTRFDLNYWNYANYV